MTHDLYAWSQPRDLSAEAAAARVAAWQAAGGDPAASPFEPTSDISWFYRELVKDHPDLEVSTDGAPDSSSLPIWMRGDEAPPARVVAISLPADTDEARAVLQSVFGLATKYDLVLVEPATPRLRTPMSEMAAYASATFWPRGAIQAAVAGGAGGMLALIAYVIGIPILSGIVVIAGGFMFVMAVWSFVHEGRKALLARRRGGVDGS